jgi:malonyl-CoA O-methyltransferase
MLERPASRPCKQKVAAAFSRAAATYDSVAAFQRTVGTRLLSLLPEPAKTYSAKEAHVQQWLDIGCGTGHFCAHLQQRWPSAQGLGLDLAEGMLTFARSRCPDVSYICADAEQLPLRDNSQDLVFSSLA